MAKKSFYSRLSKEQVFLGIILIFGLFLRLYALGSAPLWVDESISATTAERIVDTGTPRFESGFLSTRALVFHYLQAFFILLTNNDFTIRIISVIFGMATIVLGYFIGREYSKSGGLIVSLFLAVFYLEVFFSRQARMYQMFQLFFFLSLYLLYKSRYEPKYLYYALASLLICYDTQLAGLVLAPFFILYIFAYHRNKWYLSSIPIVLLILKFIPSLNLTPGSVTSAANYASSYLGFASNMNYLLVLFAPGLVWAFFKKKELTMLLIVPAITLLLGIFSLPTFALRYAYFFVFAIVLYSALLMAFLYDKYGKLIIIPILLLILIPSNLVYSQTYVNVIKPVAYNFNDLSAPYTDYKSLDSRLTQELKSDTTLISLFSLDVQRYLRKPDYVIPFSLDGRGQDQVSYNGVDVYSGAKILDYSNLPTKPYNVVADRFSFTKLSSSQRKDFDKLTESCTISYESIDLRVYLCT